jgi:hypothetical protein
MVKGSSLAQVFDRLEVLEATPNVVLECTSLGSLRPMTKNGFTKQKQTTARNKSEMKSMTGQRYMGHGKPEG